MPTLFTALGSLFKFTDKNMELKESNAKKFEAVRESLKGVFKSKRLQRSFSLLENTIKNKRFLKNCEWLLFYENEKVIGFTLLKYQGGREICIVTIDKLGALTKRKFGREALKLITERSLIWKKKQYPDSSLILYTEADRSSLEFWKKMGFEIEQYRNVEQHWVLRYYVKESWWF